MTEARARDIRDLARLCSSIGFKEEQQFHRARANLQTIRCVLRLVRNGYAQGFYEGACIE